MSETTIAILCGFGFAGLCAFLLDRAHREHAKTLRGDIADLLREAGAEVCGAPLGLDN